MPIASPYASTAKASAARSRNLAVTAEVAGNVLASRPGRRRGWGRPGGRGLDPRWRPCGSRPPREDGFSRPPPAADAYVLADTLRTDGHRWKPLRPDAEPTRALRALCRTRKDLAGTRVQVMGVAGELG